MEKGDGRRKESQSEGKKWEWRTHSLVSTKKTWIRVQVMDEVARGWIQNRLGIYVERRAQKI